MNRVSARIVLIDNDDRVLLLRGSDPQLTDAGFWFTPGGGVEADESLLDTAQRELAEETGIQVPRTAFTGPVWWQQHRFTFNGGDYEQTEYYFVAAAPVDATPNHEGFTEIEQSYIQGEKWWNAEALTATGNVVYPVELTARLCEAVRALRLGSDGAAPQQIR